MVRHGRGVNKSWQSCWEVEASAFAGQLGTRRSWVIWGWCDIIRSEQFITDFQTRSGRSLGRRVGGEQISGLHVMYPAAAAACRVVEKPHFQALGKEIMALICHCCEIVLLYTQGLARCTIMRNQWLAVGKDERVLLSGWCARVEAAGAAWHSASPPRTLVWPAHVEMRWCNRPHAVTTCVCRYLQGQYLSHEKPITVPFPCRCPAVLQNKLHTIAIAKTRLPTRIQPKIWSAVHFIS